MTESDELLSRADALLTRWRTGAPHPAQDYPVLTEAIDGPETDLPPVEEQPRAADPPGTDWAPETVPPPESFDPREPLVTEPEIAEGDRLETGLPPLPLLELPADEHPGEPDFEALEARLQADLREVVERRLAASLAGAFGERLEGLVRQCAEQILADAREDILGGVHEAVRIALAREIAARRDGRSGR